MKTASIPSPALNATSALSASWAGQLAQSLRSEHTLSDEAKERIKTSLMQKIENDSRMRNVRRDDGWIQLGKRVHAKVLHDDGTSLSWLLKLLPGGALPVHDHADGSEECMILEGSLRINGEEFMAGDYQIALPGSVHHEVSSAHGSLVYLRSPASRRSDLIGA